MGELAFTAEGTEVAVWSFDQARLCWLVFFAIAELDIVGVIAVAVVVVLSVNCIGCHCPFIEMYLNRSLPSRCMRRGCL